MKKRILRISAGLIVIAAFSLHSCEFLEDCDTCVMMTDDGTEVTAGTPMVFCGETLASYRDGEPVTVGSVTTWWECGIIGE